MAEIYILLTIIEDAMLERINSYLMEPNDLY